MNSRLIFQNPSFRERMQTGCPVALFLSVLAAEMLAEFIRQNSEIPGLNICGKEYLVSQYAHGTILYIKRKHVLNVLLND